MLQDTSPEILDIRIIHLQLWLKCNYIVSLQLCIYSSTGKDIQDTEAWTQKNLDGKWISCLSLTDIQQFTCLLFWRNCQILKVQHLPYGVLHFHSAPFSSAFLNNKRPSVSYKEVLRWCVRRRRKVRWGLARQEGKGAADITKGRENEIQRSQVLPLVTVLQQ